MSKLVSPIGRYATAYLFEGPSGSGRRAAAIAMAQASNCINAGCNTCATCGRIADHTHPDVRIIRPRDEGSKAIQVDVIRTDILPYTRFAPFEGRHAWVIIEDAEIALSSDRAAAVHALLKTLEEAKDAVHFILITSNASLLLATVRSRCQRVRFHGSVIAGQEAPSKSIEVSELATSFIERVRGTDILALSELTESLAKHDQLPEILEKAAHGIRTICTAYALSENADADTISSLAQAALDTQHAREQLRGAANAQLLLDGLVWSLNKDLQKLAL